VLRDGYQVVIVGKPNAGKSSLLNLLSGEDSAIVTEVAGTTRDVLRERIDIDGLAVELVDTAGIRDNPDRIEEEGIRRARRAMQNADAVLWIRDATQATDDSLDESVPEGVPVLVVRNKIDITGEPPGLQAESGLVRISAATGSGVAALRDRIRELAGYRDLGEGAFTARARHIEALRRARAHFLNGIDALETDRAGELLAEELRLAQNDLGEITGALSSDELLGRIFSEFCIGK
jgi:tRNA modification GTPase